MNNKAHNELRERKQAIQIRLNEIEEEMNEKLSSIRNRLNPLVPAASFLSDAVFPKKRNNLAGMGINLAVDTLVSGWAFKRGGILGKLIVPFILKNTMKNLLYRHRENILESTLKWIIRKTDEKPANGAVHVQVTPNGELVITPENVNLLAVTNPR